MRQARKPRVDELDTMMHIRGAREETLADLYQEREMRTPAHLSVGQKAGYTGDCYWTVTE